MTTATLREFQSFIPGIHIGELLAANGYTTKFGFASAEGAVVVNGDSGNPSHIYSVQSDGTTITLSKRTATANIAVTGTGTAYYVAWGKL